MIWSLNKSSTKNGKPALKSMGLKGWFIIQVWNFAIRSTRFLT